MSENHNIENARDIKEGLAYGIGEGVYFDEFEAKQDVSGLERDGEWSAAVEKQRKQAKPKSNGSTRDPGSTYSCLDPACILTFDSFQDAEDHIDAGEHLTAHRWLS